MSVQHYNQKVSPAYLECKVEGNRRGQLQGGGDTGTDQIKFLLGNMMSWKSLL